MHVVGTLPSSHQFSSLNRIRDTSYTIIILFMDVVIINWKAVNPHFAPALAKNKQERVPFLFLPVLSTWAMFLFFKHTRTQTHTHTLPPIGQKWCRKRWNSTTSGINTPQYTLTHTATLSTAPPKHTRICIYTSRYPQFNFGASSQHQKLTFTPISLCYVALCAHPFLHHTVSDTLFEGVSIAWTFAVVGAVPLFLRWGLLGQV